MGKRTSAAGCRSAHGFEGCARVSNVSAVYKFLTPLVEVEHSLIVSLVRGGVNQNFTLMTRRRMHSTARMPWVIVNMVSILTNHVVADCWVESGVGFLQVVEVVHDLVVIHSQVQFIESETWNDKADIMDHRRLPTQFWEANKELKVFEHAH